jgi:hypothetical protein
MSAKKSSRSDWGSNPRATATPPSTKYQRPNPLSQFGFRVRSSLKTSADVGLPATFSPNRQELECHTALKCIFCILCQLRHTSEKPEDEPFQNCNRIGHAHPLWFTIMDIWRGSRIIRPRIIHPRIIRPWIIRRRIIRAQDNSSPRIISPRIIRPRIIRPRGKCVPGDFWFTGALVATEEILPALF